jgi:hypothetical protein
LPVGGIQPFVIVRGRDEAALLLERVAEERPDGDGFGTGVKRGLLHFLERLVPPVGDQAPAHRNEITIPSATSMSCPGGAKLNRLARVTARPVP